MPCRLFSVHQSTGTQFSFICTVIGQPSPTMVRSSAAWSTLGPILRSKFIAWASPASISARMSGTPSPPAGLSYLNKHRRWKTWPQEKPTRNCVPEIRISNLFRSKERGKEKTITKENKNGIRNAQSTFADLIIGMH